MTDPYISGFVDGARSIKCGDNNRDESFADNRDYERGYSHGEQDLRARIAMRDDFGRDCADIAAEVRAWPAERRESARVAIEGGRTVMVEHPAVAMAREADRNDPTSTPSTPSTPSMPSHERWVEVLREMQASYPEDKHGNGVLEAMLYNVEHWDEILAAEKAVEKEPCRHESMAEHNGQNVCVDCGEIQWMAVVGQNNTE